MHFHVYVYIYSCNYFLLPYFFNLMVVILDISEGHVKRHEWVDVQQ